MPFCGAARFCRHVCSSLHFEAFKAVLRERAAAQYESEPTDIAFLRLVANHVAPQVLQHPAVSQVLNDLDAPPPLPESARPSGASPRSPRSYLPAASGEGVGVTGASPARPASSRTFEGDPVTASAVDPRSPPAAAHPAAGLSPATAAVAVPLAPGPASSSAGAVAGAPDPFARASALLDAFARRQAAVDDTTQRARDLATAAAHAYATAGTPRFEHSQGELQPSYLPQAAVHAVGQQAPHIGAADALRPLAFGGPDVTMHDAPSSAGVGAELSAPRGAWTQQQEQQLQQLQQHYRNGGGLYPLPQHAPVSHTAPPADAGSLAAFLESLELPELLSTLQRLGADTVADVAHIADAELDAAGVSRVHVRRLRTAAAHQTGLLGQPPSRGAGGETPRSTASRGAASRLGGFDEGDEGRAKWRDDAVASSTPVRPADVARVEARANGSDDGAAPVGGAAAAPMPLAEYGTAGADGAGHQLAGHRRAASPLATVYDWEEYATPDGFLYYYSVSTLAVSSVR